MSEIHPVLVVGAGPTGLTAAMELSRLGVPVRIVDKAEGPSATSRALAVQARTMEVLEQRGLAPAMMEAGNPGHAASIYSEGKQLGKVEFDQIRSRYHFILLVPQSETERILREQVEKQGVLIEWKTEMIHCKPLDAAEPGDALHATLRHAEKRTEDLLCSYVISAEGAHSSLRETLGLTFRGKSLKHSYVLGDLHIEGPLPGDELSIFVGQHGLLAAFPMKNRRFRLIATEPDESQQEGDPQLPELQALYDQGSHIPARLQDLVWSSRFRINSRMVDRLREGRIFLGGDAAHIHSPAGGQGMNTGIQDMINLCWKLALVYKGIAAPHLLDTYGQERLPLIEAIVDTTERATDLANSDRGWVHQLLRFAAPLALGSQAVQERAVAMLSELEANYRKSPLSGKDAMRGSVHPGDRVPDIHVRPKLTGNPVSLQTLLDPDRFTLVRFKENEQTEQEEERARPEPNTILVTTRCIRIDTMSTEERGCFANAFAGPGEVLVRPDGYVAACTSEGSLDFAAWWEEWGTSAT